jgi:hypothetical protein
MIHLKPKGSRLQEKKNQSPKSLVKKSDRLRSANAAMPDDIGAPVTMGFRMTTVPGIELSTADFRAIGGLPSCGTVRS